MAEFRKTQACDRCRLKKVKCDGAVPTCGNCARVGFACERGDKLARRGLPKGYTEALEKEVVRLQNLVKAKGGSAEGTGAAVPQNSGSAPAPTPFINDTFHKYTNFALRTPSAQVFLGHMTQEKVLGTQAPTVGSPAPPPIPSVALPPTSALPAASAAITDFFATHNSLLPLLYPCDVREAQLRRLSGTSNATMIDLLTLQLVIQCHRHCYEPLVLYERVKQAAVASLPGTAAVQLLNLATYYYMGTAPGLHPHLQQAVVADLVALTHSRVVATGMYINPKNLVAVGSDPAARQVNDETSAVANATFWCAQFLAAWAGLLQGTPKVNFLVDEFQPRSLNIPILKPFSMLVDLVVKRLDGANLQMADDRTRLTLTAEDFRAKLSKLKMYHSYHDSDSDILATNITLSKPVALNTDELVNVGLTLTYLVLTLLARPTDADDIDEVCYEILTLYYLLLLHYKSKETAVQSPQVPLRLMLCSFLPLQNADMIALCEDTLGKWASRMARVMDAAAAHNNSQTNKRILKNQYYWKFNKFKKFLIKWALLYYAGDIEQLESRAFVPAFNIDLSIYKINEHFHAAPNPQQYLKQRVDATATGADGNYNLSRAHSSLLKTNSRALLDQLGGLQVHPSNHNMSTLFRSLNTPKMDELANGIFADPQGVMAGPADENMPPQGPAAPNSTDPMYLLSPLFVGAQDETDDGYAEDDDEGSCDNMEPLEIPFKSKRRASMFPAGDIKQRGPVHTAAAPAAPPAPPPLPAAPPVSPRPDDRLDVKNLLSPRTASRNAANAPEPPVEELQPGMPFKRLKTSNSFYLLDRTQQSPPQVYAGADSPPQLNNGIGTTPQPPSILPHSGSLLGSRMMPPPYGGGNSVTSISQLLSSAQQGQSVREGSAPGAAAGLPLPTLPRLAEGEASKSFVSMLLLPSATTSPDKHKH
ncbi:Sip4 protein [Maudiozyma humilis]|uniref:Sip4 protein n=1 Tax=Maudiozyma humilis TaxID=51915 RepID=A0AAV5S444_MAUHU|nr:Sip4 protein [Kazachstania humilis]